MGRSPIRKKIIKSEMATSTKVYYTHLVIIFRRTSEFLTSKEILPLLYLNSFLHEKLQHSELTIQLACEFLSFITTEQVCLENLISSFNHLTGTNTGSIQEILECLRYSKNLIANPYGKLEFKHWKKTDGGHGWGVEQSWPYRNLGSCFASSFEWGSLTQKIDLKELGSSDYRFVFVAGSPICRRFDCGGIAKIRLKFTDSTGQTEELESKKDAPEINGEFPYVLFSLCKEIEQNTRKVDVSFLGKDTKWWAGRYGARFGYCFAFVFRIKKNN